MQSVVTNSLRERLLPVEYLFRIDYSMRFPQHSNSTLAAGWHRSSRLASTYFNLCDDAWRWRVALFFRAHELAYFNENSDRESLKREFAIFLREND